MTQAMIHGAARGADKLAGEWAQAHAADGVTEEPHPAWQRLPATGSDTIPAPRADLRGGEPDACGSST